MKHLSNFLINVFSFALILPFMFLTSIIYRTLMAIWMVFLAPALLITRGKHPYAKLWWHYTISLADDPLDKDEEMNMNSNYNKAISTLNQSIKEHAPAEKWNVIYQHFDLDGKEMNIQDFRDNFHRVYTQSGLEDVALALVKLPDQTQESLFLIGTTADVVEVKDEEPLSEDHFNGYKIIDANKGIRKRFDCKNLTIKPFTFSYDYGSFSGFKTTRIPVTAIRAVRHLHPSEPLAEVAEKLTYKDNGVDSPLVRQWRFESERYLTVKNYLEPLLEDDSIPDFIRDMMTSRIPYLDTLDDDMASNLFEYEDFLFYFLKFSNDLFFMPFISELSQIKDYHYIKGYLKDEDLYTQGEIIQKLKKDGHQDFIDYFVGTYVS